MTAPARDANTAEGEGADPPARHAGIKASASLVGGAILWGNRSVLGRAALYR